MSESVATAGSLTGCLGASRAKGGPSGIREAAAPHALHYPPPADLQQVVARFFVTRIVQGEGARTDDLLLNEAAIVQLPLSGEWSWRSDDGTWRGLDGPVLFGPRARALRVRAVGDATVVGFAIRPGGWPAIDLRAAACVADGVEPVEQSWSRALSATIDRAADPGDMIEGMATAIRDRVAAIGTRANAQAAEFEALVRAESNTPVTQAASALGMKPGSFDRLVRRHFGHSPKRVLRRGRFLDMAGAMHGLAPPDADALASVRFYDASHLNREFRMFVDMTPGVFARAHTPLLNAELAARQPRPAQEQRINPERRVP